MTNMFSKTQVGQTLRKWQAKTILARENPNTYDGAIERSFLKLVYYFLSVHKLTILEPANGVGTEPYLFQHWIAPTYPTRILLTVNDVGSIPYWYYPVDIIWY